MRKSLKYHMTQWIAALIVVLMVPWAAYPAGTTSIDSLPDGGAAVSRSAKIPYQQGGVTYRATLGQMVDKATLAALSTAYGVNITGPGTYVLSANTTVTTDIQGVCGVIINPNSYTLTFQKTFDAPPCQQFSAAVAGLKRALPEWFGAAGDSSIDDVTAFVYAFASISEGGVVDVRGHPSYAVKSQIPVSKSFTLKGNGPGATTIKGGIRQSNNGNYCSKGILQTSGLSVAIEDMTFDGGMTVYANTDFTTTAVGGNQSLVEIVGASTGVSVKNVNFTKYFLNYGVGSHKYTDIGDDKYRVSALYIYNSSNVSIKNAEHLAPSYGDGMLCIDCVNLVIDDFRQRTIDPHDSGSPVGVWGKNGRNYTFVNCEFAHNSGSNAIGGTGNVVIANNRILYGKGWNISQEAMWDPDKAYGASHPNFGSATISGNTLTEPYGAGILVGNTNPDTTPLAISAAGVTIIGNTLHSSSIYRVTNPATSAATSTTIIDSYGKSVITLSGCAGSPPTGNAQTLGAPTITTAGKYFTVYNASYDTCKVVVNGVELYDPTSTSPTLRQQSWRWNGASWVAVNLNVSPDSPSYIGVAHVNNALIASNTLTGNEISVQRVKQARVANNTLVGAGIKSTYAGINLWPRLDPTNATDSFNITVEGNSISDYAYGAVWMATAAVTITNNNLTINNNQIRYAPGTTPTGSQYFTIANSSYKIGTLSFNDNYLNGVKFKPIATTNGTYYATAIDSKDMAIPFTPTILIGGTNIASASPTPWTYTYQLGEYTRVGERVCFQAFVMVNVVGSALTGALTIGGLPYSGSGTYADWCPVAVWGSVLTMAAGESLQAHIKHNDTVITPYAFNSGNATQLTNAALAHSSQLSFSGCYHTPTQ